MGSFALHDIYGVRKMVILRSRSEESVLVAIIAGTEQPKPIIIGTNERPDRPIFLSSLSITKATLAM
ncbi:unknown [Ruminococcus sp. CAG:353]|nr:unknown [Ruminococcus sp. CAG:353]